LSKIEPIDVLPLRYAGLLLRTVAGLADLGVVWLFAWLVSSAMGVSFLAATPDQLADTTSLHMLNAIVLFFAWLYCAGMESSPLQATLGMAIMGLYTADPRGARVGMGRTTIRFWMRFLSIAPLFCGFLPILLTARRQAVHDMFAGCVVLKR
jgi:uncharacterized RDD family membrane protein YckC